MKIALLFLVKFAAAVNEILLVPNNTVVMAGEKMIMNCLTSTPNVLRKWSFENISYANPVIYKPKSGSSGGFHLNFTHFGVEVGLHANGLVSIFANSTRPSDAGIYTCHCEVKGEDVEYSAHLIVLESLPTCESNLTTNYSHSLIDGDHIWIQCSINFKGFWAPSMEWIQHGRDFGPEGKTVTVGFETMLIPSHSVTSKLTIARHSLRNGSYYSCKIYFAKMNGTKATTADNVPNFAYKVNSSFIHASHTSTQSVFPAHDEGTSSAIPASTTEHKSSVDWYLVSLSLVAAFSIFFILVVVVAIARCVRFKRKVSDHYASTTKKTIEMPVQESAYDVIPYATSEHYETIGEEGTEPISELSRPRLGSLPTPGYSGLMPVEPSVPPVYSRMESYGTPVQMPFVSDSTLTKVSITTEVILEKQTRNTESPLKDSPTNRRTYLEVRE